MKIIASIMILTLMLGGYASAANAFGLVSSCSKEMMAAQGMKDCCDKDGKAKPANCLNCQCCTAAVYPTGITGAAFELPDFAASPVYSASNQVVIADFNYLPLRPPNPFA
jgi:hypothetical protein